MSALRKRLTEAAWHVSRPNQPAYPDARRQLERPAVHSEWFAGSQDYMKLSRFPPVLVAFNGCQPEPRRLASTLMTTVIRISFLGRQHVPASQTFHLKLAAAIALPDAVDVRHHQVVAVWHVRLSQPHCHCRVAIPKDSTAAPRGLPDLRFHDLRHTVVTRLLEAGEPDHVVESITGHLSRRMLEHYSHIRLAAKKQALDRLGVRKRSGGQ